MPSAEPPTPPGQPPVTRPAGPPTRVRRRVVVSGLVQGVFFRDTCRRVAERQEVAGWVRNLPDGTVEAVFEGPADRVDRMVGWARTGPSRAIVREVTVHEERPEGLAGFRVRA